MKTAQLKVKYVVSEDPRSAPMNKLVKKEYPVFINEQHPDMVLVSGGDGAMLHAIQNNYQLKVPFLGYAAGTLNFLMNTISEPKDTLKRLVKGQLDITYISTRAISVEIYNSNQNRVLKGTAVNEVVIGSDIMGYHGFDITAESGAFRDFSIKGTGICVSTDLGSTGYNFNLGGSVLPLGTGLWSIMGIVCNRYLNDIINSQKIHIKCLFAKDCVYIFLDGIKNDYKIGHGDSILIRKGGAITLAFLDKMEFIQRRIDITSRYRKT